MTPYDIQLLVLRRMNRSGDDDALNLVDDAYRIAHKEIQSKALYFRSQQNIDAINLQQTIVTDNFDWVPVQGILREVAQLTVEQRPPTSFTLTPIKIFTETNIETLNVMKLNATERDADFYAVFNTTYRLYPALPLEWSKDPYRSIVIYYYVWLEYQDQYLEDFFSRYAHDYLTYRCMREVALDFGFSTAFEQRVRDREDEAARRFASFEIRYFNKAPLRVVGGSY
jgi:hypothetical protein